MRRKLGSGIRGSIAESAIASLAGGANRLSQSSDSGQLLNSEFVKDSTLPSSQSLAVVCLKSFGDLVIARYSLQHSAGELLHRLVIGDHLEELNEALGSSPAPVVIRHREGSVPALFDVKKMGVLRALRSGAKLRGLLSKARAELPADAPWLFDQLGMRERLIAGSFLVRALPVAKNVYLAYRAMFGIESPTDPIPEPNSGQTVGIFPGSRIAAKNLPSAVVDHIVQVSRRNGARPLIFCLDGESHALHHLRRDIVPVPRNFAAMTVAVKSVDKVVSADSFPAHLAEFCHRPVFVVSPHLNRYWLPLSCTTTSRWMLFDSVKSGSPELDRFIGPKTFTDQMLRAN